MQHGGPAVHAVVPVLAANVASNAARLGLRPGMHRVEPHVWGELPFPSPPEALTRELGGARAGSSARAGRWFTHWIQRMA